MVDVIIKLIIPLLCTVITAYIIPYLKEKKLYNAVKTAVQAAEQIYKESGMGEQKFEYVKSWLNEKFSVSADDLKKIIESAVYELNKNKSEGI